MTDFHVYDHPLLAQRIVKIGFSWPAFFMGPAWFLFKKLWIPAAVTLVVTTMLYLLNRAGDPLFAKALCLVVPIGVEPFDVELADIFNETCRKELWGFYEFVILFSANLTAALMGNDLWANGLINRGYVKIRSIKARSPDEVNAILARESAKFASTQPNRDISQKREQKELLK